MEPAAATLSALTPYLNKCRDGKTLYLDMSVQDINKVGKGIVVDWLRHHFPQKGFNMAAADIMQMLYNLSKYVPIFHEAQVDFPNLGNIDDLKGFSMNPKGPYKQLLLENKPEYYYQMNLLPEAFMDLERLRVRRADQPDSPLNIYQKDTEFFLNDAIGNKPYHLNVYTLREAVYHNTFEATEFKPSVLAALIEKFKPKSVLDFCAGRGARLVACIAKGVDYTGVDPDTQLTEGYNHILNALATNSSNYYNIIYTKAQDLVLDPLVQYDMIMTSPPYFDLEVYSNDKCQSISEFPQLNQWLDKFLITSIRVSLKYLRVGGHLIININDPGRGVRDRKAFTINMVKRLNAMDDLVYLGVIGYAEPRKPAQPLWIWQKRQPVVP